MEKYILVAKTEPIVGVDKNNNQIKFPSDNYYFDFSDFHNEIYGNNKATISNQVLLAYIYFNYTSTDASYSDLNDKYRKYWVGHIICVGKYGNVGQYNLNGNGMWMGFEFNKIGGNIELIPSWKNYDINRITTDIPIDESELEPDLYMKFTIL